MSAEPEREFIDANILVYALDASAGHKHAVARQLVERLWNEATGCLSVQVLQEFFVTITRKAPQPLSSEEGAARVREFAMWRVFSPAAADVLAAIALHQKAQLNFWDAMVVHAAAESGCSILWTEDLSDGQRLCGVLVRNPFKDRAGSRRGAGK